MRNLMIINLKEIKKETIIRYKEIKELCKRKYKGHNKGCPNIEKCKVIPFFDDIEKINKEYYYLLYANFQYDKYQELRKLEKSEWTDNQVRCVLYWQNSVKKLLKETLEYIYEWNGFYVNNIYILGCGSGFKLSFQNQVYSMESVGINVFSTLKLNDIPFDIKAINNVKLVCLICSNYKIERY